MPKQTFISKEFFVNASNDIVRRKILELPDHISYIKFIKENSFTQTLKFSFHYPDSEKDKHVDVSILALNENQTLITLHCSYADGCVFSKDLHIQNAIENFELATNASLNNKISAFEIKSVKRKPFDKFFQYINLPSLFS